jgi:hypothetical protein
MSHLFGRRRQISSLPVDVEEQLLIYTEPVLMSTFGTIQTGSAESVIHDSSTMSHLVKSFFAGSSWFP